MLVSFLAAILFPIAHVYFRGDKAPLLTQPAVSKNNYHSLDPGDLLD